MKTRAVPAQEQAFDPRLTALRAGASDAGRQWAVRCCDELRREGRAVQGGWPGTLAEARSIVRASMAGADTPKRRASVTSDELEWLARVAYASARQDWLSRAEREAPDCAE